MNAFRINYYAAGRWIGAVLAAGLIPFLGMASAMEERFDLLKIGTRTFTNVTVTTKAKNYIFLLHAGGMTSIKTTELPVETKQQLGYAATGASATNTTAAWAKREFAKINAPMIKELGKQLDWKSRGNPPAGLLAMGLTGPKLIFAVLGIVLLIHLFECYCCLLICRKTGNPPGVLIWLPVLQLLPLLRAAGMSGWWFLGFCVPVLNLVAQVLWCFNIAQARGKSTWTGLLLFLPITNLFAFLYLAFSNGTPTEEEGEPEPQIMTLEAA